MIDLLWLLRRNLGPQSLRWRYAKEVMSRYVTENGCSGKFKILLRGEFQSFLKSGRP
jgi:hypothetical protein